MGQFSMEISWATGSVLSGNQHSKVVDALPSMAAEDFAFMLRERPGCYFWLGAARSQGENPGLHSSKYDFNDEVLPLAANFWISLVLSILKVSDSVAR